MSGGRKVIQFPGAGEKTGKRPSRQIRKVDGIKYCSQQQIKHLRRTARDQAGLDRSKGEVTGIREWMTIDLITSTGLRVSEAANARCAYLRAGYGENAQFVRDGKGSKSRAVQIPDSLRQFSSW